jgi:plastocyanin
MATAPAALAALALPAQAASHTVTIKGRKFRPATITIKAGDTITWKNNDGMDHTATAKDKSWGTQSLSGGASGSVTFSAKGEHRYICKWHPGMKGKVIVT